MNKLRHPVAAMLLLATLIALLMPVYQALIDGYGITESGTRTYTSITTTNTTTGNIAEQLDNLRLVNGISDLSVGITKIASGSGLIDIVGGLAGAALGILKTFFGLLTIPYDIVAIITLFYSDSLPMAQLTGVIAMITVYVGFIVLSAYLRKDV